MRILFSSHFFAPGIGGIEQVGGILAHEFASLGHEVIVITQTSEPAPDPFPFEVRRRPGVGELIRLTRRAELVFHNNISLQTAWPLVEIRRPWVIAHHTWIARPDGRRVLRDLLKLRALRFAHNIAVSRAIASSLPAPARVIPNPYREDLFRNTGDVREREVMFLGRLVSDKGADLLIEALGLLKQRGTPVRATIGGRWPGAAPAGRAGAYTWNRGDVRRRGAHA